MAGSPSRKDVISQFDKLNVWKRGWERAPHKPLLILYALGKWSRDEPKEIPFSEVEQDLTALLKQFGPSRHSYHPEYPFWRLQNDGVWHVDAPKNLLPRKSNTDPKKTELLKHDVHAGFSESVLTCQEPGYSDPRVAGQSDPVMFGYGDPPMFG